ncbi:MAG: glycosyltransferase [Rubripirellula sp.]
MSSNNDPPHTGVPTKLMFVIDTLEIGGTEQSLLQLVGQLGTQRFDCTVVSLYPGDHLANPLKEAGAEVLELKLRGKYAFGQGIRQLSKLIKHRSPDLVHTMLFRANQIGRTAGWLCGVPVVSSFVNVPYDKSRRETDPSIKAWKLRCLQTLDVFTSRWVVKFHSVSETAKEVNCRDLRVPTSKVTVVPRGRDTARYERQRPLPNESSKRFRVLNVGRLIAQKGQLNLIDAFQIAFQDVPEVELAIAGDGPLMEALQRHANDLQLGDRVAILGRRNDVPDLLTQADIFAFPSHYEGLPGSLIEAMLAGLPIVASDIPQIRELIEHEKTGLIVPGSDAAALANGLARLFQDRELAARLGAAARASALSRFNLRTVTEQMESFYCDIIARTDFVRT